MMSRSTIHMPRRKENLIAGKDSNIVRLRAERIRTLPAKHRTRVLLLQGPVGPFFARLADHLMRSNFDVWRVVFNAGDRLYAGRTKRIDFSGSIADWEKWFRAFAVSAELDYIILFGSSRVVHRVARQIAEEIGVKIISLEEGYIRPGFVTAELGGNNADSPLAGLLPPDSFIEVPERAGARAFNSFTAMCRSSATYYVARTLFSGIGARDLFHRRFNPLAEPFFWARNAWRSLAGKGRDFTTIERLLEHFDARYFLVPLQVAADSQMGEAAREWNAQRLITEAMASFAKAGPADHRLVFKVHPLERGHSDARRLVRQTADIFGIADRVDVVENGSLGLLARHSAGMITINSTSGLSAIFHGVPILVIGDAVYAHPEIATVAYGKPDFDRFWSERFVAEPVLRRRYLTWLRQNALVPGDFYADPGIEIACKGIVKKLDLSLVSSGKETSRKQAC